MLKKSSVSCSSHAFPVILFFQCFSVWTCFSEVVKMIRPFPKKTGAKHQLCSRRVSQYPSPLARSQPALVFRVPAVRDVPGRCCPQLTGGRVTGCARCARRYPPADHERPHAPPAPGGAAGRQGLHRGDAHPEGPGHGGLL